MDGSYESSDPHKIVNSLLIENLQRRDLHSILTCQASNNNISNPVSTSVKIDMHCKGEITGSFASHLVLNKCLHAFPFAVGPLSVDLITKEDSMSAGKSFEAKCQVVGARPPPRVTWWRGASQIRDNITTHVR